MGPGGQPDLQQIMQQALAMQQQLASAQAELAEAEVSGSAGGGLVTVTMSGSGEVRAVSISPEAVDPEDVETLEDLVLAALHAAAEEQRQLAERTLGPLAAGLPGAGDIPGMPGFPGLPGS
jgi:DNA-binding YbaB/EbfC family protein